MKMNWGAWLCFIIVAIFAVGLFWYWEAENFSESAVSGRYTFQANGEASTLVLKPDHSFEQTLERTGTVKRAKGTWEVFELGHIAFSNEFLKLTGEETGEAHGQIGNWFGLVSITLAPDPGGPKFQKKLFG